MKTDELTYLDIGHEGKDYHAGDLWCVNQGLIMFEKNTWHTNWEDCDNAEAKGRIDHRKKKISFVNEACLSPHRVEYIKKQLWKKFQYEIVEFY